jgi:predicted RNase H-like nuclease
MDGARREISGGRHVTAIVLGVDGCPAGWVVVSHPLDRPEAADITIAETFSAVLDLGRDAILIAVDMPIGLPDRIGAGGRACDVAARRVLGARQSAVFAMPSRAAVMCEDYRAACAIASATSEPPRRISKQAFNLFPKVREVDALMTPELQETVREVHPEVAFWALNGHTALDTAKKVKSRPNPEGLIARRALLAAAGYDPGFLETVHFKRAIAGPDDVLDATVNASAAARIARGEGIRFPDTPNLDAKGLRMEIWG